MLNVLVVSLCKPVIQKSKLLGGGNLKIINQLGEPQKVGKQMLKFQWGMGGGEQTGRGRQEFGLKFSGGRGGGGMGERKPRGNCEC